MEYHISVFLRIGQGKKRIHPMRSFVMQQMPKRNHVLEWIGCTALHCYETKCRIIKHDSIGLKSTIHILVIPPVTWTPIYSYFNEMIGYIPPITETNAQFVMNQMGYMFDGVSFEYQFEYIRPVQAWKVHGVNFQEKVITMVSH
jgi:hypothetical protein